MLRGGGGGGGGAPPSWLARFASKQRFAIGMALAIALARVAPGVGARGGPLRTELIVERWGVATIFLLSGLGGSSVCMVVAPSVPHPLAEEMEQHRPAKSPNPAPKEACVCVDVSASRRKELSRLPFPAARRQPCI